MSFISTLDISDVVKNNTEGFFGTLFIVIWNGIILENIWKLNAINSSLSIIEYLGILCSDLMFKTISSYWATFQFLGCDWPLMTGSSSWWFVALLQLFINVLMGTRDLRYREISLSYSLMGFMKAEYFYTMYIIKNKFYFYTNLYIFIGNSLSYNKKLYFN